MTKKISDLAAADPLDGTELLEAVQAGVSVQTTTLDVAGLTPAAGNEENAPATDGTITQGGATLTTAGYVRGVVQATQHSYEKTLHVNVELTVPSSDEGGSGSQISVNLAAILDVLDSLNGGGWYLVNIGGIAAVVSGTVGGTAFAGYLNDDGTLYGFDGNPITTALTDDDVLNFRASWIISND